jgi:hypothetical protein
MELVYGSLLDAEEEYIVHSCCCTARSPDGLTKIIISKWPCADPYKMRRRFKNNWTVLADRPEPGTIKVMETDTKTKIIWLFAQYYHGEPDENLDPIRTSVPDSHVQRLEYFRSCLDAISTLNLSSIALSYDIYKDDYNSILHEWSENNPTIKIRLYDD